MGSIAEAAVPIVETVIIMGIRIRSRGFVAAIALALVAIVVAAIAVF